MSEKKVYQAIAQVTEKLAKEGISKSRNNAQQGYKFRGIDDVYNALAPFLASSKLCILPNVQEREVIERQTKSGGALFYVTVKVDFAFVSAEDGSEHHVITYGEAMDSGDKATNKAMSAAYKYAAMQAFCIPTEGDNDADATTHEVKPNITPTAGTWEGMDAEQQKMIQTVVDCIRAEMDSKGADAAYALLQSETAGWSVEEKTACWTRFDSKERSAMKKTSQLKKAA
jgi:hypothetical protein